MVIVFEGIGGAGKTTISNNIYNYCINNPSFDLSYIFVNEFTDSYPGDYLKRNIDNKGFRVIDNTESDKTKVYLFCLLNLLEKFDLVEKNHNKDIVHFMDGFFYSQFTHLLADFEFHTDEVKYLIDKIIKVFQNNIQKNSIYTIFLDCQVELAISRIEQRNKIKLSHSDIIFLNSQSKIYKQLLKSDEYTFILNANRDIKDIRKEVISLLKSIIIPN